jgi:probable addiction module antidote protein
MPRSRPYKVGLNERLKDPVYAAGYLNAARRESQSVFLLALRDVVQAHRISKIAADAGVNRETLYRTLSPRGNPTLATLEGILEPLGVELEYRPRLRRKRSVKSGQSLEVGAYNADPQIRNIRLVVAPQGQDMSSAVFGNYCVGAGFSGPSPDSAHGELFLGGIANTPDVGFRSAFIAAGSNELDCGIYSQL